MFEMAAVENTLTSIEQFSQSNKRFPKSSIRILKRWITTNAHDPHPTETQKALLQDQTGLTLRQVNNWFANARRRGIHKSVNPHELYSVGSTASISVPNIVRPQTWKGLSPLDRWRNSPPEQEAASLSDIANAVTGISVPNYETAPNEYTTGPFMLGNATRTLSETSFESLSSFWTSDSSSRAQSVHSDAHSAASKKSSDSAKRKLNFRRHRSVERTRTPARKLPKEVVERLFQCTFCTDTFKTKYDWTRHESTLHLVLERWTCTPQGPTYFDDTAQEVRCAFCDIANPSNSHALSHNSDSCDGKPPSQRSFRRKDHLQQHLRNVHGVDDPPKSMSSWKATISHVKCRCGFCGEQFNSWSIRNEHISNHFRDGKKMKDWKGDRGLDTAICILVENAMPPYLIGQESQEFEPFTASRPVDGDRAGLIAAREQPTRFEDLTGRLAEYVLVALQSGTLVNDEVVRRQARIIMFGDDDAWNQTPADNAEWLRLFKIGLGLDTSKSNNTQQAQCAHLSQHFENTDKNIASQQTATASGAAMAAWTSRHFDIPELDDQALSAMFFQTPSSNARPAMPLIWQTPECLAEFREMHQDGQAPYIADLDSYYQPLATDATIDDFLAAMQHANSQQAMEQSDIDHPVFDSTQHLFNMVPYGSDSVLNPVFDSELAETHAGDPDFDFDFNHHKDTLTE